MIAQITSSNTIAGIFSNVVAGLLVMAIAAIIAMFFGWWRRRSASRLPISTASAEQLPISTASAEQLPNSTTSAATVNQLGPSRGAERDEIDQLAASGARRILVRALEDEIRRRGT
ncbi:hypothetical protein [Sorangium sp. So ce341]|uniref:hypothetical protein n=1 Tax=Sorangium sp. So ce341 TaxID=3133302 RepID=UPI003F646DC9